MPKLSLLLLLALFLVSGCDLDEGNRRGYVISKTHELPPEDAETVQP